VVGAEEERVVLEFLDCAVGPRQDVDRLVDLMSEDIVWYPNVPSLGPFVGREACRAEHEGHRGLVTLGLPGTEVLRVESGDRFVFAERVDVFEVGGVRVRLPVIGVFEVENSRVAAWREYFDLGEITRQLGSDTQYRGQ
jgi:limonene-1,2-epoxide hydrolase